MSRGGSLEKDGMHDKEPGELEGKKDSTSSKLEVSTMLEEEDKWEIEGALAGVIPEAMQGENRRLWQANQASNINAKICESHNIRKAIEEVKLRAHTKKS